MFGWMKQKIKREKGFTLVELLAVIAILAIIVAIAVPTIGNVIGESTTKAEEANAELFENAARLATVTIPENSEKTEFTLNDLVTAEVLEEIPVKPGTEDKYAGTLVVEKVGNAWTFNSK